MRPTLGAMSVAFVLAGCASATARPTSPAPASGLTNLSRAFQALSDEVGRSVVHIEAQGFAPDPNNGQLLTRRRASGSGVIVSQEGHIITNAHVVQGAQTIRVRLPRTSDMNDDFDSILKPMGDSVDARVVGIDFETDIALIDVDVEVPSHLSFSDSDDLRRGQVVLAFGSPLGLEGSVSMGVVSAVARQIRPEDRVVYVQTDAPINPGNSGGPLVNSDGELVGINTFILSQSGGSEGLGFAVPSNIVRTIYEHLQEYGRVRRGTIAALTQTVDPLLSQGLGLDREWGVIVSDVLPGGPADAGGLQVGDIILSLDGKPMENARQFEVNVYHSPIGGRVAVQVRRGERDLYLQVPVVERPNTMERLNLQLDPEAALLPQLGVLALTVDDLVKQIIPQLRVRSGVLVAAASGSHLLRPGDVIHRVNDVEVESFDQLGNWLALLKRGDPVVLQIERQGRFAFIPFQLE
ncbi:MAG: trypsin-like peptidase domain-containing protein [Myxococcota bacterium]